MPLPSLKNQTWIPAKNCGNDRGGDGNDRRGREFMKSRKTGIIVSICVVVGALAYLALGNFWDNLVYFCTPSEVKAFAPDCQKKVRVGGMVVKGTVKAHQNQDQVGLTFKLTDGEATIPVTFEGIPPDLFKEGQGAVVEGYWTDDHHDDYQFISNLIMAKHSEDYMPIELKRAGVELPRKDFMKSLVP